jgi:hypothetical protein
MKRLLICAVALAFALSLSVAANQGKGKEGTVTGWISDSHCASKGAPKPDHGGCATSCVKNQNAKYVLYSPSDKKVYSLDAQDKAGEHSGHHVKVTGTVEGDAIKVKAIEMTGEQKGK